MAENKYPLSEIVLGKEEEEAVLRVVRSRWLSMGPETNSFESEFGAFLGCKNVLATSNCTASLHMALLALGIGKGDEVIVPALSFVATANAVLYVGAQPVFADVESLERPLISADEIEKRITPRTKALIVMHYAGYPCAMDRILPLAKKHGVAVIEDAAHSAGSFFEGRSCGTLGDIGCFSFFGNKNLPMGEGGALVASDPAVLERARVFRSHGMTTLSWDRKQGHALSYDVVDLGYNFRMPELSAAIGREQLKRLKEHNRKRDEVFNHYRGALQAAGDSGLLVPFSRESAPGSRHLMPVLLPEGMNREKVMTELKSDGVQSSIHYRPIYQFAQYRRRSEFSALSLPVTERFADRVITLPFHPGLQKNDVEYIVHSLLKSLGRIS